MIPEDTEMYIHPVRGCIIELVEDGKPGYMVRGKIVAPGPFDDGKQVGAKAYHWYIIDESKPMLIPITNGTAIGFLKQD